MSDVVGGGVPTTRNNEIVKFGIIFARLVAYAVFQINILFPSKPGTIAIYCHLNPEPVAIFYFFNSSKNILFSICGFAFPFVSFIACPTKNPNALSFPAL